VIRPIAPMLATTALELPRDDAAWAHEFKWDGVRALVFVDGDDVCIQGRRTDDITLRYPELAGLGRALGGRSAILDGEVVALDDQGRPSFQLLQHRMHVSSDLEARRRMAEIPAVYMAFDLLLLDGRELIPEPYTERRRALDGLGLAGGYWQAPPSYVGEGPALLAASRSAGLEGIVAKKLDSAYEPGRRSRCWLKLKNLYRQEFVIGGWSEGEGIRSSHFGSLLVGYYDEGGLHYAGNVGTGFTDKALADLMARLKPLRRDTSPFVDLRWAPHVVFVEPRLVAEVEFRQWTDDGRLRAPSFKGLRDDKDPSDVVREVPS
jgi:bifunctional non-homologous end joining protein LigD